MIARRLPVLETFLGGMETFNKFPQCRTEPPLETFLGGMETKM